MERCRTFLLEKNREASRRAAQVMVQQFQLLVENPDMGRPIEEIPTVRELIIPFGDSGYVALYRHEPNQDTVYILAFRHQKEAGF